MRTPTLALFVVLLLSACQDTTGAQGPPPTLSPLRTGQIAFSRGDYATAFKEWLPLAEQGDPVTQSNLGYLYLNGYGVPKSYDEALNWYKKAAKQGSADAQYNIGAMYQDGHGVWQSDVEASIWYRKAAEQGYAAAQNNLGIILGDGGDNVEGYMWLHLAAVQGDEKARRNRDITAENMTPEQIAEAQGLAREWKPKKE